MLADSIASAEKKLETCDVLFGKIEGQLGSMPELRELLSRAARLPVGGPTGSNSPEAGAGKEPGLIGRSLNLLAGMLSNRDRLDS